MTNNELLLAMSDMMDTKLRAELQPLRNEMQDMKNEMRDIRSEIHQVKLCQENQILPRLETIESCYIDTFHRYRDNADRMEAVFADVDIMKKVIAEHSKKLQKMA